MSNTSSDFTPYVPADKSPKEFTFRAIVLGFILSIVFSAGLAFIGLRVGITISASVPAAVVSMVILRTFFKNSSILENNMVQTLASAGESLAAGAIFTLPALLFLGEPLPWWRVTILCALGGTLGVLLMIPLRQHLIVKEHGKLPFPEGTACAEILKAGESDGKQGFYVVWGVIAGLAHKFMSGALHLWEETPRWIFAKYQNTMYSIEPSAALMGVGYIIGPRFAAIQFAGGLLAWFTLIPLISKFSLGLDIIAPASIPVSEMTAQMIWSSYIRYIGIGGILVGGFLSLLKAAPIFKNTIKLALLELSLVFKPKKEAVKRTEKELSMLWVMGGILFIALALYFIPTVALNPISIAIVIILGFFFTTITSQIAGLVGTSVNPVSGMVLTTLFVTTSIFVFLGWKDTAYLVSAITVASLVCMGVAIAADTSQDLKTGFLLGATPKKQQIGEILGVIACSLVMGGVLHLLDKAYVLGSEKLSAPQATMIAEFGKALMTGGAPWELISIGIFIGIALELVRVPSLPFALGIYLPIALTSPIMLGGVISLIVTKLTKNPKESQQRGVLLASGLVAGEALMGLFIALGVIFGWINLNAPSKFGPEVSLGVFLVMAVAFAWICLKRDKTKV
jgi:putative OPT family oligopeptide transporter